MKIKTSRTLAKRWANSVRSAAAAYSAGVLSPRRGQSPKKVPASQEYVVSAEPGKSAWARRWEPYRKILLGLKLPPRGPVRSAQNYERVLAVCEALHAEKVRRERQGAVKRRLVKMPTVQR